MTEYRQTKSESGFTIIEVLINIVLIALVGLAILSTVVGGLRFIQLSKERVLGLAIANAKMEELRNLPYDDLATENGTIFPPGTIPDQESITRENVNFTVEIRIDYVDDPFDGDALGSVQGKPVDLAPYDYKKIQISVTKVGRPVPAARLVTNVGASAAETEGETGILLVIVLDAQGQPVSQATVTVENPATSVDITTSTDNAGRVMIPSLPPDNQNHYHVEATKTGYSTDFTSPATPQNPNPVQQDVNIFVQQVTTQTLAIDVLSSMTITLLDASESPLSGVELTIESEKLIYTDPNVPKFSTTQTTNALGQVTLVNIEWGSYLISPATPYVTCSTFPFPNVPLSPNTSLAVTIHATTSSSAPRITNVTPTTAQGTSVTLTVTGSNFAFGAGALLRRLGQSDLAATDVTVATPQELSATFDLTGATAGLWDLLITNPDSQACLQPGALTIP